MSLDIPSGALVALLLATIRASAWLVICPPFNTRAIPAPVKAMLAVALALPVMPQLADHAPDLDIGSLLVASAEQVVAGAALGFITFLFFAGLQAAGDLIDLFGGFSLAHAFDPFSHAQTSVFGRFYNVIAITLLFATDGHQMVLRGFLNSYKTLPLDGTLSLSTLNQVLTHGLGDMFLSALQIAGPLIAVLICADVALGLLTRVAPALNAFSLGFPAKIFLVLSLAGTAMAVLPGAADGLVDRAVVAVVGVAGG